MKRLLSAAIAGALVSGVAVGTAQAGPGAWKMKDPASGVEFKFGMTQEWIPEFVHNLDYNDNTSQPNAIAMSSGLGRDSDDDRTGHLAFESRLFFTASKGRLELYTQIEWDGIIDERAIDHNNPNIERTALSLALPEMHSKFTIGADFFLMDSIGRMVYLDDDPGFWLDGSKDNIYWKLGYNKRNEFSGRSGDSGGRAAQNGDGTDHDILRATLGFKGKTAGGGSWLLEPYVLFQNRGDSQADGAGNTANSEQQAAYLGIGGHMKAGVFDVAAAFVYHTGTVSGLTDPTTGVALFGFDEMDISAFAVHARAMLDLSGTGWPLGGVMPVVAWDWASGDDDPNDDELGGFVPVTTPNGLRVDQGECRNTTACIVPTALGNGSAEFGFETNRIGTGPKIGNISELGVGGSPGYHRIMVGLKGKLNPKWGMYTRVFHLRYDDTSNIDNLALVGNSVDEEIGWGFDLNLDYWATKEVRFTPFISVFFPGDASNDIIGDDATAVMGGVNIKGSF